MNEDWRNAFGTVMYREICDGAGAGYAMVHHQLALVYNAMPFHGPMA